MRNFTISDCCLLAMGSINNLVAGLLLSIVTVFLSFNLGYAQEAKTATNDGVVVSGEFDPEVNIPSKPLAFMKSGGLTPPAPNPGLGLNTTCANLRVAFVLDESRSIITRNAVDQVKEAVLGLAEAFQGSPAFISVIEFDQLARVIDLGTNQVSGTFINNLQAYLYDEDGYNGQTYAPAPEAGSGCKKGYTNWEDALLAVDSDINLVIFVTDGDPNTYNASNSCGYTINADGALEPAIIAANAIKENGTHMFAIGVGDNIYEFNIQQISGPSNFALGGDIWNTDYLIGSFADLKDNLTAGLNAICGTEIDIEKSIDHDQVCSDETITFNLTVTNTGGNNGYNAAGVVVTDTFPSVFENLAIVGEVLGASLNGHILTYDVGTLAPGESATIQISANIGSAPAGVYTNIAHANAVNANRVNAEASVEKTGVITSIEEISACESYTWNGDTYNQSGTYTYEGENENGCPTHETLVLTINTPESSELNIISCGSWTWERTGQIYNESFSGDVVFEGENGECDEVVTLNIIINPADEIYELCTTNWPFFWEGEMFFNSGIFYREFDDGTCALLHLTFEGFGDSCFLLGEEGGVATGTINEDCECVGTPVEEFDCPELSLNIGDNCTIDGESGVIDENCNCFVEVPVEYCFSEDFSEITAGNNTSTSGSNSAWSGNANFPVVDKAYQAGGAVKLGTGSVTGYIQSNALTDISGEITVSLSVKGWTTVEGDLIISIDNQSQTVSYSAKMADDFENISVSFTGVNAGSNLKIETTAKRAFIDDVRIICGEPLVYECPDLSANIGDSCTIDGESGVVDENCNCFVEVPVEYCFAEDFSEITAGNNTSTSGSNSTWSGNVSFPDVDKAYQAGGAVRIGNASASGYIKSEALTDISGEITVSLSVKGWTSVEGDLIISIDNQSQTVSYLAKMADDFENISVSFTGVNAGSNLKIETTAKRAFIDNVRIICGEPLAYDCPELSLNFGDPCQDAAGDEGTIDENCNCYVPFVCEADAGSVFFDDGSIEKTFCADDNIASTFEFLFLPGNLSDSTAAIITDAAGYGLFMTRDIAEGEAFDFDQLGIGTWHVYIATYNGDHSNGNHLIFDLFLNGIPVNINDLEGCYDISNQLTLIGESCQPIYECPELEANIGDPCDDGDDTTENDVVGEDCVCAGTPIPPVFDCPDLQANIGDDCTNDDGKTGTVNDDCDCYVPFECTADAGSVYFSDGSVEKTYCADDDIASTFEFLFLPGDLTDSTAAIITDADGWAYHMIRDIAIGEAFDFDQLGIGTWHIYIVAYNGEHSNGNHLVFDLFKNGIPVNIDDLEGCFDISNELTLIGESCQPIYECPELEANIGDPCDDGDDTTENDVVGEDCVCAGTPIPPVFDCPDLQANIGDDCWENDEKGVVDENCNCVGGGTPITECEDFAYFIANNKPGESTTIYGITLTGGIAELHYITEYPEELHLAYNEEENLLYGISKMSTMYVTMNPYDVAPAFGPQIQLNEAPGEVTGAVFSPSGELLIASQTKKAIFIIDLVTNDLIQYDDYAPVFGGDLAFSADGTLYLVTNMSGGAIYEVYPEGVADDLLVANTATQSNTGMAITDTDQLLISVHGHSALTLINTDGSPAGSYPLMLDGEPFTLDYGDMASGCNSYKDPDETVCTGYATFYAHYNEDTQDSDIYSVSFEGGVAHLTHVHHVPFEVHIGYDAENEYLYMASKTGSFYRIYDVGADQVLADIPFSTTLNHVTAVEYSPHDQQLYVGHQQFRNIYTVNPADGQVSFYGAADVYGGDIAIFNNGTAYLATQWGDMLYNISDGSAPVAIGNIPTKVTGMAIMGDNLVTVNHGSHVFYEINPADGTVVNTYTALLNGEAFELGFGDMAGGCITTPTVEATNPKLISNIEASAAVVLTTYPNPTEGDSKVFFKTSETTKTLVEVYDMNGRYVATLFNQEANAGQAYTLDFNGNKLPNGVYVYRLTTQNETIIEKFMIAR